MIGALRISPRKTTASDPLKSITKGGRQSCLGFDVISFWKSLESGARSNQAMINGTNAASIRGKKARSASLWVTKPTTVTMSMARTSPIYKIHFGFNIDQRTKNTKRMPNPNTKTATIAAISTALRLLSSSVSSNGFPLIADLYGMLLDGFSRRMEYSIWST